MSAAEIFKNSIVKEFCFLKETNSLESLYTRGIKLEVSGGMLFPLCRFQTNDIKLIEDLSEWRKDNFIAYPTRFPVTINGTSKWLVEKLFNIPDRILFLIKDKFGRDIGHLGFANCYNDQRMMEIDNVVRGVKNSQAGIMSEAMIVLMRWARTTLWPETFYLRVLLSNTHAVSFYKKLGFSESGRIPLRLHTHGDCSSLEPIDESDLQRPDDFFIRMELAEEPACKPGDKTILTAGPSISQRESSYAFEAASYGWNNQWAKYLKDFENAFSEYVGIKYAIATSSCTGALHIALTALGIGPGDEVIVPDITWVATANAVLYVGATPVFADVDSATWVISPESIRSKITGRTKAIIPVHLYGHPCDMNSIQSIANEHNLYVVEDAAPSIGAEYKGRRTGGFGDFGCFSFQGAKLAVTGEGGMLVTNDKNLYEKAYAIWDQGRKPGTFWIQSNGLKYKMSNVQAAIGLGQIQRNDAMVEAKRRIFQWYTGGLKNIDALNLCREPEDTRSIYWMSSIELTSAAKINRSQLIDLLKSKNIDTRPVFPAISQYPIWPIKQHALPNAKIIGDNALNLPSGVCLRRDEVYYICKSIREILSA